MKLKRILYFLLFCVFLTVVLVVGKNTCLPALGSFLVVKDQLRHADAIVVLGGDDARVDQAVKLYKEGFSKTIIMSGAEGKSQTAYAGEMKRHAVRAGVPEQSILLESKAGHTYQHPIFVKPIMVSHGFTSAIVVSSPYHMRRSEMLFNRTFHNSGISLIYYPQMNSSFDAKHWWKNRQDRHFVFLEYTKMAVNFWGTGFSDFTCAMVKGLNSL